VTLGSAPSPLGEPSKLSGVESLHWDLLHAITPVEVALPLAKLA
jgi:hypothetical protein